MVARVRAVLAVCALARWGGGCLTEEDWTTHAPAVGGACAAVEARVCSGREVLRCSEGTWALASTCATGESCADGACVCPGGDCCGNGRCEASRGEDCKSCPADCGSCCTAGTVKCEGTTLKTCSAAQTWTSASCTTLCRTAGYNRVTGCAFAPSLGKDACLCAHDGKIGDPCKSSADCLAGSCNGSWCQKTCKTFSDCGTNSFGDTNWCIGAKDGTLQCFPSCYGTTGCSAKFPGTTCQSTKTPSGVAVSVCASSGA